MRRRIVTLTVLAAVLATVLFGLPLAVGAERYFAEDARAELQQAAESAALSAADELFGHQQPLTLPDAGEQTRVALYSPDGRLQVGEGPALADRAVRAAAGDGRLINGSDEDSLVVAVPVADRGKVVGVVRAVTSDREVLLRTVLTWLTMAGLALFAVLVAWLVSHVIAGKLSRPLEELSGAARRLGDGDFSVRPAPAGVPEIDSVATSMGTTAQRLGQLVARERAFSANASHQLRTPLAGLRLQLELALDDPEQDPDAALRSSVEAADRLERTIDDLLLLARAGGPVTAPADVPDLLAELREGWNGLLTAQGRRLEVHAGGTVRPNASVATLRQVLTVLLDNATTHGAGTVTMTARDADGALAIDVADEGRGVPPGRDPFVQRGESSGHGIGLALARGLAEAAGGRLRLSRATPPMFTLLLPVADEQPG
ncbi:HAMP domain-containing sensor histidine kinase [Saccharopolyspora sp. SCSIO 74807]|uniref:sensor histidine kinase n=1 Tax=Saccharopolyspora sp. SCSIO 74807 TaxID=3118084 RepID=UPI0030CCA8DD